MNLPISRHILSVFPKRPRFFVQRTMSSLTVCPMDGAEREPLCGTVDYYERHILVGTGTSLWPQHIHRVDEDVDQVDSVTLQRPTPWPLVTHLHNQLHKLKALDVARPKFNAITDTPNSMLIFPEMVRYDPVDASDAEAILSEYYPAVYPHRTRSSQCIKAPLPQDHFYIFACIHGTRDARCGSRGPALLDALRASLQQPAYQHLRDRVHLHGISHVGGHKFAGNLLIYGPRASLDRPDDRHRLHGDWYGYVDVTHIPRLLEQHLTHGQLLLPLWRGALGLTEQQQLRSLPTLSSDHTSTPCQCPSTTTTLSW